MGKVKVKSVRESGAKSIVGANPILVRFEHAKVNPNTTDSDLNQIFGAAVFQCDKGSSRDMSHLNRSSVSGVGGREVRKTEGKQVVALQSDAMTYLGTKGFDNPSLHTNSEDNMWRTFVALKHKKKMRIFEVSPITVSPYLEGHSHIKEPALNIGTDKSKEERKAAGIDLVKTFGSKKKRLTYERMEKNQIDITEMQDSIDAAISKVEVPSEEPTIKDESILTLIPHCNRSAAIVQDVYCLNDILTLNEINAMDELVHQFLAAPAEEIQRWKTSKMYSDYFFHMLAKLQPKKDQTKAIHIAKVVLYTELLIQFLKLKHDQVRKKRVELPDVFPLWITEKVMDNFSVMNANGTRNRPEAYKDKTCCYIMVLVLLANDFMFDVQLMSTSLNIHIKKLLTLARAVGITVMHIASTKEYRGILKLPLPKPIERRGRRRAMR